MTQQHTITTYSFDELSDAAKEKAREWFRSGDDFSYYAKAVIEDAKEIGKIMGIEIEEVYYSGFSSQGDGASFKGHWAYEKGSVKAIKSHATTDTELHRIAADGHLRLARFGCRGGTKKLWDFGKL